MSVHLDRARAESFGSVAADYDSFRPTYPDAFIDDLAALGPEQVLDVGCGTGMVATALAGRGLSVLGVEPDARMAAVAQRRGVPIEVAAFESWPDRGRQFDLLTCGAAWHWIDPSLGTAKAARVVRPGGAIARFWNYEVPDEPVASALETVYRRLAPEATRYVSAPEGDWPDPLAEHHAFGPIQTRIYAWDRTLTTDEWIRMASTFSDHQRMPAGRLAALQEALSEAIESLGGTVRTTGGTDVRLGWRA